MRYLASWFLSSFFFCFQGKHKTFPLFITGFNSEILMDTNPEIKSENTGLKDTESKLEFIFTTKIECVRTCVFLATHGASFFFLFCLESDK